MSNNILDNIYKLKYIDLFIYLFSLKLWKSSRDFKNLG